MRLSLLLIALLSTIQVHAWASKGHQVAAAIADRFLTQEARSKIEKVLAQDTQITFQQRQLRLSSVASWADAYVRSGEKGSKTSAWHYLDLKEEERDISDEGMENILSREGIVKAIVEQDKLLRDTATTLGNQLEPLKFLIHLIADVTQPYHVDLEGRNGGNDREVEWKGIKTNLHEVWDRYLINEYLVDQFKTKDSFAGFEWATQLANSVKNLPKDELKSRVTALINCPFPKSIEHCAYLWALDTANLHINARDFPPHPDLYKEYYDQNIDIVAKQLLKAGVRLAIRLNLIFSERTGFDWLDSN